MKIIYSIITVFLLLYALSANANDVITFINKKDGFNIKQTQTYTSLYYKNTFIEEWGNEWYRCDKEWGYTQSETKNAKTCIADELSLKHEWKNWYYFKTLKYNYSSFYLYNTKSKELFEYWSFDKVLQNSTWKTGIYYLLSIDTKSPWNEDNPYEFIMYFKNDWTYEEIYTNTDRNDRLISYELLLNRKIRLKFQENDKVTYKIISIK